MKVCCYEAFTAAVESIGAGIYDGFRDAGLDIHEGDAIDPCHYATVREWAKAVGLVIRKAEEGIKG